MAGAKFKKVKGLKKGKLYGKSEASKLLKVTRPTVQAMVNDGRLEVENIGGRELVKTPEQ